MDTAKTSVLRKMIPVLAALALAMGISAFGSVAAAHAAGTIDVNVTISNQGTLALAHQKVTVTDVDKDGKYTLDEVLQATHKKYYKGGASGYATADSQYGLYVTKLWGEENGGSYGFYKNDAMTGSVDAETVAAGDDLVAYVMKNNFYPYDDYAFFNKKTLSVKAGKSFTLNLNTIYFDSNYNQVTTGAPNVQVGTWNQKTGKFTALKGKTTDKNGKVKLSFAKAGTYVVSANGTYEDAPLSAPACVVTVTKNANPVTVTAKATTVKLATAKKKAVTVAPLTVKKAQGKTAYAKVKWSKKATKYLKLNTKTGKVTVKKGTPKGTYTFKVKVTAKGNGAYKAKTLTKAVKIKVA